MTSSRRGEGELAVVFTTWVPLVRLVDGRPFGADLPMAAPGRGSEVKAGRRPPPEAARAVASGLDGASRPVTFWQVRAEGPLGNEKSALRAGLIPGVAGPTTGKGFIGSYRFVLQSGRDFCGGGPTKWSQLLLQSGRG
jgi:hypothetical protein